MQYTPKENNAPLSKFESMLKTNSIYFFDSLEFEEIIHYYIDSGKIALAKKAINLGLTQHVNSIVLRLLHAEILIFDGAYNKAAVILKEIQAIEPSNGEVYVQQASIFSKIDDHSSAINTLKKALEFVEDAADVFSMIGMEYLFLDNFDEAQLNFAKCLEVDFEDYSSLYNVIYCFDMQNKHQEAIVYLNKYLDKDPYNEVAWQQLGRQYFILEMYQDALGAFDYAVVIDELFVGAYLEKAKTLEKLKRYKEAIENYKITIELEDPTSYAYLRIGKCYENLKNTPLAILFYKKALYEDPQLDKGLYAVANLYLKEKKYNKALHYINKALEIDAENTTYWRSYAKINLHLNFYEEVVVAFSRCIALQDTSLEIWLGLCDVQCFLGDDEDALVTLIKASLLFENTAEIEYRMAGLYLKSKNKTKGEKHLQTAFEIDFEHHTILKELHPKIYASKIVQQLIYKFKSENEST